MLQSMGSQRVRHDLATEQQQQLGPRKLTGEKNHPGSEWESWNQASCLKSRLLQGPGKRQRFQCLKNLFKRKIIIKNIILFFFFNMELNQSIKTKRFGEENTNGMCFQDTVFQGSL